MKLKDCWHKGNIRNHRNKWKFAKGLGLTSSICSVEGCFRDAIGFMWANRQEFQSLSTKPGLIDKNKTRAEELKDELQKCIFHTDKENEIWTKNWDEGLERWKSGKGKETRLLD